MAPKKTAVTTEYLRNWTPTRTTTLKDAGCRGLWIRGGPTGVKTFYRFTRNATSGKVERVKLGRWAIDGGAGVLSLDQARKLVNDAREHKHAQASGAVELTVGQLAQSYRRDVLAPNRERADEAWNVIRVHITEAKPDPKGPAFGERPARQVRAPELGALVRYAKESRLDGKRRLGGPGAARVVLRELRALFAHGVETGALEMSPAATLRSRAFGLHGAKRRRYLDADEVRAFFGALDLTTLLDGTAKRQRLTPTVRLALAFQLYVPLRSQSLIGARWEEFDLDAGRWTVPVARLKLHKEDRKDARPFVVPLPATAVAILKRLREEAGESPWVLAGTPGEDGQPRHLEPKALIRALTRLQRSGRLAFGSKVTVHDLRRTWRRWAQELDVPFEVAERSLGHTSIGQALGFSAAADVYARGELVEQRAKWGEVVAAAFDRLRLGTEAPVVPLAERRAEVQG